MASCPDRRVGSSPTGDDLDARVQDIKWSPQGDLGWATLRVEGWDFTQVDYRERMLLSLEAAERLAPVTNGGIVFEPGSAFA